MRLSLAVLLAGAILVVVSVEFEIISPSLNRLKDSDLRMMPKSRKHEASLLPPSSSPSLVVDVLSTGSTSRWDYIITQQRKWGSHPSIRHFEGVNETHHGLYNASCNGIKQQILKCYELANATRGRQTRLSAPGLKIAGKLFRKKSEGWMCAQHRPVIGLHSVYGTRYRSGDNHPDWLLLVDDDTTFHMNVLELAISRLNPDTAHVLVGKYIFHGWPLGGFGIAFSRGAIRRLFVPIYCNNPGYSKNKNLDFKAFSQQFCQHTLQMNLIFEQDEFVDGMSIMDIMLAIQLHRRPFCWHSDWYMGWFLTHHIMLGEALPKFPTCPEPFDCRPNGTVCDKTTLMCHDKNKTRRFQNLIRSAAY